MLSQRFIILAALLFPTLYAAPAVQNSQKLRRSTTGHALVNSYIVVLKDGSSRAASLQALDELVVPFKDVKTVTTSDWTVINGFAADLSGAALQHVLNDPNVAYVEENAMVQVEDWQQTSVPQNLVSESSFADDSQSHFAPPKGRRDGVGTEIYVIDSGIRTTHETFSGRARWGASFAGEQEDKFEHGTYLASVAAGEKYGSAVKADIIAVKVLGDFGGGSWSTVINGIDFVTQSAKSSKKLGLAVLGVYGAQSSALDKAILNSVAAGVHYTVSAGTWELDPSKHSPAHLDEVVTVGAINSTYAKAEFSGSGKAVDIWYSGVNVVGASSKADDAVTTGSSTSAAASGVVGLLSCALSTRGKREPAALKKNLLLVAEHDVTGLGEEDNNARAVRF